MIDKGKTQEHTAFRPRQNTSNLSYELPLPELGKESKKMLKINWHLSNLVGSLDKLSSRLKMAFCVLLTFAGLLLGGMGITSVYSQDCNNYNCPGNGTCTLDTLPDCQDWCIGTYRCYITHGRCPGWTAQFPIDCTVRRCVNPGICPGAQP